MFKRMINLCLVFVMLFAIFQLDYVSAETDFDAIGNQLLRTEGIKVTDAIMLNLLEYTIKVNDAIGIPTDIESLLDDLAVDRVDKVLPGFEKIVDVYELFTKSIYAYKDYYKAASGVPSAVEEVLRAAEDTIETGIEKQVNLIGSIYHAGVGHRNTNESIPTDLLKDADRVLKDKRLLDVIYENADLTLIKYFAPSVRTKMLKLAEDYENFIDNTPSALSIYNLGRYGSKNGPDELNILAEEIPADKVITSSQIETAIAWATNKMNNDDGTYINYCLKFVGDAWKQANITTKSYGWAKLAADDMVKYSDKNPPRGAVVFYDYYNTIGGVSRNWGHAAISLGNGKIIHALNTGIKITNIDMGSNMPYLGWGVWDNRILATAPVPPETPGEPEEPKEIKLQDLPKFYLSSSHKFINNETVFGVNYKFGIKATGYGRSTFYLGEEFNSLNFKLAGKKAKVRVIDGDNNVILREVSTTNTDTVKEVNVDVRGIDELEIYFGGSEDDFIIAEPYLHKDKITTEGSLITHKELYEETKPNLFQIKSYLGSCHEKYKDSNHLEHNGISYKFGIKSTDSYSKGIFCLDGDYSSLNFKLVGRDATVEVIDGNNEVILKEANTTKTDTVKEVNVDVRGIDELKIKFSSGSFIAEPYLHRDKITTEGSLITHKELYDETKPNLFQIKSYLGSCHEKYKDSNHLEHNGISYKFGIKSTDSYSKGIFCLDEDYSSLNFKLVGRDATVEVTDGNNEVILKETNTTKTDTVKEVNVDVRGIDELKIKFSSGSFIAEPYLHKDKITTEGSLITHKELYDETKPNLFQIKSYLGSCHEKYKDSNHLEHNGISYKFGIKSTDSYSKGIFCLDEDYSSLNFKLVGRDATVEVIDGNNEVILKEANTTKTDTVKEVNVDVRGIDELKIKFSSGSFIAEPYLHRDKITTEGSLITHKELYDETKPNLFQIKSYLGSCHEKYKDSDHLEHNGISYKFGIKSTDSYSKSIFCLDEDYSSLNFKLVGRDATVEVIDGNNEVILKEANTTKTDTVKEVNVDVRGIDELKIKFSSGSFIAEPYLDFSGTEDSEEPGEPIIDKGRYTLEEIAEAYANYVSTFWRYDREQVLKKLPKGAELPNKWCSAFIGQTAEAFGLSKIIPLNPGVGGLYRDILSLKGNSAKGFYFVEKDKYNVENSTYTNRDNFIPKVGDLVIFKWNDAGSNITFSHVGIVTKVENPEKITVIHGNTDKSDVGKWYPLNFRKNNSEVVAFVRPNYGAISDEWTGKIKHSFECPVDVCVIFDGEELNSATDSTVTSFGTMTIEEDCITVILDYGNPYNIVVTGKDEGTMKLTTEFDTNHGQNTRSFIDIPITKNTTIHVYADAATAGIELLVEPNDAETTETIWYAEPGDTVEKENEELTNELLDESWTENIIISIREDKTVIDTDGGTLQLIADIFPEREIEWTVEPITGEAVIDQNGLLTAIKNGTVTVTAATKDGSDIKESIDIIISNQTEWKTWESKYDIALDKTWTVEFNKILDAATVKGSNIYVTDQNNQVVSTSLYQQNNKKVCVIPTKNYQSGHTYILWIKGLKAEDGSLLGENVKMEFTIK